MTKLRRIGLVDMGSNAIRTEIIEFDDHMSRTLDKHRAAVRLGADVFATGAISDASTERAIDAMRAFRDDCDGHRVESITAVATSAVREAINGAEFLDRIEAATDVRIEAISGETEAHYLRCAVEERLDPHDGTLLLADLGGGSIELVRLDDHRIVVAKSYPFGALRLLRGLEPAEVEVTGPKLLESLADQLAPLERELQECYGGGTDHFVATGGNIETLTDLVALEHELDVVLGSLACSTDDLERWTERLAAMPQAERKTRFSLRPDRADAIVPAGVVYSTIARFAGVEHVIAPRVGIRAGMRAAAIGRTPRDG